MLCENDLLFLKAGWLCLIQMYSKSYQIRPLVFSDYMVIEL